MSFKNTLIVLTSNIGSRVIASYGSAGGLGAFMGKKDAGEALAVAGQARLKSMVLEEVKSYFRPELLNRWG